MKNFAEETKAKTSAADAEKDQRLLQLVRAYLRTSRMDDEAARTYADYAARPAADPDMLARLAEIFCARRDWHALRLLCERMEKISPARK
jgi:uncharacterized protein HemY